MKKRSARIAMGLAVVGTVLLIGPTTRSKPQVFAQSNGCTLRSLGATYGFSFAGYLGSSAPYTPLAAAGTITFRPDGTIQRDFGLSFGGQPLTVMDAETYSLNEDCTFSADFPQAGEVWNLIPVENGRQIEFFINTSGRVGAGTLIRQ